MALKWNKIRSKTVENETIKDMVDNKKLGPRITAESLRAHCKDNNLYLTPKLNDVLYLHYKGYSLIENLDEYTGLRCLWLENNAIRRIENLNYQTELRSLFLHNNCIRTMENLEHLRQLDTLNLSRNYICKIENIDKLPVLNTLVLSNNQLSVLEDVEHLKNCDQLSILDLGNNTLRDPQVLAVFGSMKNLRVLTLTGNPVIKTIPSYRKSLILNCKHLQYLDGRPVFSRDRLCAEAWERGGAEEEQKMRQQLNEREQRALTESFKALVKLRDDRRAKNESQEPEKAAQDDSAQRDQKCEDPKESLENEVACESTGEEGKCTESQEDEIEDSEKILSESSSDLKNLETLDTTDDSSNGWTRTTTKCSCRHWGLLSESEREGHEFKSCGPCHAEKLRAERSSPEHDGNRDTETDNVLKPATKYRIVEGVVQRIEDQNTNQIIGSDVKSRRLSPIQTASTDKNIQDLNEMDYAQMRILHSDANHQPLELKKIQCPDELIIERKLSHELMMKETGQNPSIRKLSPINGKSKIQELTEVEQKPRGEHNEGVQTSSESAPFYKSNTSAKKSMRVKNDSLLFLEDKLEQPHTKTGLFSGAGDTVSGIFSNSGPDGRAGSLSAGLKNGLFQFSKQETRPQTGDLEKRGVKFKRDFVQELSSSDLEKVPPENENSKKDDGDETLEDGRHFSFEKAVDSEVVSGPFVISVKRRSSPPNGSLRVKSSELKDQLQDTSDRDKNYNINGPKQINREVSEIGKLVETVSTPSQSQLSAEVKQKDVKCPEMSSFDANERVWEDGGSADGQSPIFDESTDAEIICGPTSMNCSKTSKDQDPPSTNRCKSGSAVSQFPPVTEGVIHRKEKRARAEMIDVDELQQKLLENDREAKFEISMHKVNRK
nr:PREDICTED: dynein assembly factor 1, axonemal homolog [Bemisia tabaci]